MVMSLRLVGLGLVIAISLAMTDTANASCATAYNCQDCKTVGSCHWCRLAMKVEGTSGTPVDLPMAYGICQTEPECVQSFGTLNGIFSPLPVDPWSLEVVVIPTDFDDAAECDNIASGRAWNLSPTCQACHLAVTTGKKNIWCERDATINYVPGLVYHGAGGICLETAYEKDCVDEVIDGGISQLNITLKADKMTDTCPSGAKQLKPAALVVALMSVLVGVSQL